MNRNIVIVGATSSIAEYCAREWAIQGSTNFTLICRDQMRTNSIAADLLVRNPESEIDVISVDFLDPAAIDALISSIHAKRPIDIALIAHGVLPDQQQCQDNLIATEQALIVNGISPALFAEGFAKSMERADRGTLAIIGSVAGDRGRKSNYVYGAAKGLLARYAQGLQHRLASTKVKVVLIKPGPTDTPMTAHLKQQGEKLAKVEDVARSIVRAIEQGKASTYAPAKWALIMTIIRHLPSIVFNKLNI